MNVKRFFFPADRAKKRGKKGYYLLFDIFFHSSSEDYYYLRLLYNLPLGIFIGWAIYTLAWNRLNFGEFDSFYSLIFKWVIISGSGLAFAISPIFRCATVCVCIGGLGKTGQGILALYVAEQVNEGPISNIMYNFELTTSIVICHLELQGQMAAQKLTVLTGPAEMLFEKHFGKGVSAGKKMINLLKSVLQPFRDEIDLNTEEDEALASVLDGQKAMASRDDLLASTTTPVFTTTEVINSTSHLKSGMSKLKSAMGKSNTHRMEQRCKSIYAMATRQCEDRFADAQAKCYDSLPIIGLILCWQFNSDDFCKPSKLSEMADRQCNFHKNKNTQTDLNAKLKEMDDVSRDLDKQLKVNIHFQAVEQPQNERLRMLSEIAESLKSDINFIRVFSKNLNEVFSTFMLFFVYMIFRDAVGMIKKYGKNIEFNNRFLTRYFWRIDEKRRLKGQFYLGKLTKKEKKTYKLQHPISNPSLKEVIASWQPLLRFFILCFVVSCIVFFDHVFYKILEIVTEFLTADMQQQSQHSISLEVKGNGTIAEMIRNLLQFNYTDSNQRELSNRVCMVEPRKSEGSALFEAIFLPLMIMFFLQVLFNFIIKRINLFFVVGFFFRPKAKARVIHLYNKVLAHRINDIKLQKARIKYMVDTDSFTPKKTYEGPTIIAFLVNHLSKHACTFCQSKHRTFKLNPCDQCGAHYCGDCRLQPCHVCHIKSQKSSSQAP